MVFFALASLRFQLAVPEGHKRNRMQRGAIEDWHNRLRVDSASSTEQDSSRHVEIKPELSCVNSKDVDACDGLAELGLQAALALGLPSLEEIESCKSVHSALVAWQFRRVLWTGQSTVLLKGLLIVNLGPRTLEFSRSALENSSGTVLTNTDCVADLMLSPSVHARMVLRA